MSSNEYHVYELSDIRQEERATVQDCAERSQNTPGAEVNASEVYMRRATVISCLLFIAIIAGLAALYAMHFDFRGTWYRDARLLRKDIDQFKQDADNVYQKWEYHLMNLNASLARKDEQLLAIIDKNAASSLKKLEQLSDVLIDAITPLYTALGWNRSGNMFYKCFEDEPVDYQTANTNCQKYHGRLAAATLRDRNVVRNIINAKCHTAWIGFNDIKVEGQWEWSDGGRLNRITTEWYKSQPSNSDGGEDCAEIIDLSRDKLLLNDKPCALELKYICEITI